MFRITMDPSSGSSIECLAKIIVMVFRVRITGHEKNITIILVKHCIELPVDGSLVIRNMLEQF